MSKKHQHGNDHSESHVEAHVEAHIEDHSHGAALAVNAESFRDITIGGSVFLIANRFATGHVITAGEADALNQTFAENVRNSVVAKSKRAADIMGEKEVAGVPVTDEERLSATVTQEALTAYAADYVFGVRKTTVKLTRSPVEAEERRLAREAVTAKIKSLGFKMKEIEDDKFESWVATAIAKGTYRGQAEQIVAIKSGSSDLDIDIS